MNSHLAHAACITPPSTDEAIARFQSAPEQLIYPGVDTRTIETKVRDLSATNAALAKDIVGVAQIATPQFRYAIAAGLAQAALACSGVDQQAAQLIQQAVASSQDSQFQASFAAITGDLSTAAIGIAASSAANAAGSVPVTNANASSGAGFATTARANTARTGILGFAGPGITGLSETAISSVSPVR